MKTSEAISAEPWNVYDPNCPTRTVLDLIASRWTVLVIGALTAGPRRFGQLERHVGGISAKVLTQVLRALERDGLVTRTLFAEVPPRTVYELTELGAALTAPLGALPDWAEDNIEAILAARASNSTKPPAPGLDRTGPSGDARSNESRADRIPLA